MRKNPPMLSKDYYEQYAKLTLAECGIEGNFELSDKPDLQDKSAGIGIEVVRAITEEEGFSENVWNKYSGKGLTSTEFLEKNECKDRRFCWDIDPSSPELIGARIVESNVFVKVVIQKIKEKAAKQVGYANLPVRGLYLFTNLSTSQISEIVTAISVNNFPFDKYYLNLHDKLVVIDSKQPSKVKEYPMSTEQIIQMQDKARGYEMQRYLEKISKL